MAEERNLPGWPKKRLVADVRRSLWAYGIRPNGTYNTRPAWRLTWEWAAKIANSYYRTTWPRASEIAAQYIVLLLSAMRENVSLRLPGRAGDQIPAEALAALQAPAIAADLPRLEAPATEQEQNP